MKLGTNINQDFQHSVLEVVPRNAQAMNSVEVELAPRDQGTVAFFTEISNFIKFYKM